MPDQTQAILATKRYYADNAEYYAARVINLDLSALWDKFSSMLPPERKFSISVVGAGVISRP